MQQQTESTAAIRGHPIHPMLVPFPIAFLVGALASDLAYQSTADPFWARASMWLIAAGLVMGAIAALAGLIDFLTISRARSVTAAWVHFLGNAAALGLSAWNLWLRVPVTGGVPISGIVLSAAVVVILVITGWMGGELAYRHHIGVIAQDDEAGTVPAHRYRQDRVA